MLNMSSELLHVIGTSTILFQNILVRLNIVSIATHCRTALVYTIADIPSIPSNKRCYSVAIHHIVTIILLTGAIKHDEYINSTDLMLLESTTCFNMIHKLYPNVYTKQLRNVSWLAVRLIFLPMYVLHEIYKSSKVRYDIFVGYSHLLMTLMILSLEWTNEVMKTNFPYFSNLYYLIPLVQSIQNRGYTYTCMVVMYTCISILRNEHTYNRFEDRILFKGFQTYMLLKMYDTGFF